MKRIDEALAEDGGAAREYELPEVIPAGITVSRPNPGQATVPSVRLSSDEHDERQRSAEEAHLPVSTLVRVLALQQLDTGGGRIEGSVESRLDRREKAVFDHPA